MTDLLPIASSGAKAPEGPPGPGARRPAYLPQRTPLAGERRLLLDLVSAELERALGDVVRDAGEKPYRVRQVREWVFGRLAESFEEMSNLPLALRRMLTERYALSSLALEERALSSDGTEKFIWRLADGREVESVSIPAGRRLTFCISSQVGCPLACSFCATGKLGYTRQLTAGEIVDQVRTMLRLVREGPGEPASEPNLVFMGQGEPLLNLRNVIPALAALNDPAGLGFGARRITVSTSGVAPRIGELAAFNPQVRLAISLHAPNDALRNVLVPLNRRYPLERLMEACREFATRTGKRITFEYVHLPGVNDLPEHPAELRDLLGGLPSKINLIPYNPVPGLPYRAPREEESERFLERLRAALRCSVTLRRPRGRDIAGACGQLELERRSAAIARPAQGASLARSSGRP